MGPGGRGRRLGTSQWERGAPGPRRRNWRVSVRGRGERSEGAEPRQREMQGRALHQKTENQTGSGEREKRRSAKR